MRVGRVRRDAVIFCFHGMWGTEERFNVWRPVLEEYMPVEAINLERSCHRTIKYADYHRQVNEFTRKINADKKFIIGHSMGGRLAQDVEDECIVARGLVSPAPERNGNGVFGFLERIFSPAGLSSLRQIDQIFTRYTRPTNEEAKRVALNRHEALGLAIPDANTWKKLSLRTYLEVAFGFMPEVPKRENVHVVVGSDDLLTEPYKVERTAKKHGGTFEIIPGHDHMSIMSDKEVARNLIEKMIGMRTHNERNR